MRATSQQESRTKSSGLGGARDSGEVRQRAAGKHQQERPRAARDQDSDYYDDYEMHEDIPATFEDEQDKWTKESIVKAAKDRELVKAYELHRKQPGVLANPADDDDPDMPGDEKRLNRNWRTLRYFVGDRDALGNEQDKGPGFQSVRLRLNDSLTAFDPRNTGLLDLNKVLQAFNRVQCGVKTELSHMDLEELFVALRVFHNRERQIVAYRDILAAPTHKEERLMKGIFPAIKAKEERKSKSSAHVEVTRQQEQLAAHKRSLDEQEKKRLAVAIKAAKQTSNFGPRRSAKKKTGKEVERERRAQEKIEDAKRQIAKREQDEREVLLAGALKQEMFKFNQTFNLIKEKVLKEGGIENKFRLADKNGDGELSIKEFYAIRDQYKISIAPSDINFLFDNLDKDKSGKISYREMMDAFKGRASVSADVKDRLRERLIKTGKYSGITPSDIKAQKKASHVAEMAANSYNDIRTESGMSELMKRSDIDMRAPKKLIDENEHKNNYEYIREHLNEVCPSFDEMVKVMGTPLPGSEDKVSIKDFQRTVLYFLGNDRFSGPQIKFVFKWMVQQVQQETAKDLFANDESRAYIPVTAFKDKFVVPHTYKRDVAKHREKKPKKAKPAYQAQAYGDDSDDPDRRADSVSSESSEASVVINAVLENRQKPEEGKEGEKFNDRKNKLQQMREQTMLEQDESPSKSVGSFEIHSDDDVSSIMSNPIDNVLSTVMDDPRSVKARPDPTITDAQMHPKQQEDSIELYNKESRSSIRKKLRLLEQTEYDRTLDTFIEAYCKAIDEDLLDAGQTKSRAPETLVDRYGKMTPGFINFEEFREIYKAHVHEQLENHFNVKMAEENKLRALFNVIDPDNKHRITRMEYAKFVEARKPASDLLVRLTRKMMKGSLRLWYAMRTEFKDADAHLGTRGSLPLPIFQTIMGDYDMPMVNSDREVLHAKQLLRNDVDGDTLVVISDLLDLVKPKGRDAGRDELVAAAVFIQRLWRRYLANKPSMKQQMGGKLEQLQEQNKAINKGLDYNPMSTGVRKQQSAAPKEGKTEAQRLKAAEKRRAQEDLASGMRGTGPGGVVTEADRKVRSDAENFIKNLINGDILPKALSYGESLTTCRDIQGNFENRPVTKNLFPLLLDVTLNVQGVQPKSLQTLDSLGQVMFLDSQNSLSQYDLATEKVIPNPMNLGTRPPLKHYPIIDMVCDQKSGRIYTLNGNWILEIWNMNQDQDNRPSNDDKDQKASRGSKNFPEKRIAVCTNEGGKDFINLYYRQSYNNSKPKFLSLQESNQQILMVNTTCIDSSIVFIDPISFSVLKKVTLRYQDYEIPKTLKKSIMTLRSIFDDLKTNKGKTMASIFDELLDRDSEEIKVRAFVDQLCHLEVGVERDQLWKIMHTLDQDGSGTISLDEFISFFDLISNEEEEQAKAKEEQLLHDELWPQWLIREDKLNMAQNLFANMAHHLNTVHGFSAEAAFALYDSKEDGAISREQFLLIMNIFFSEILTEGEIDFLQKLCVYRNDQKIFYREFCKFLDKRLVRTFKNVTIRSNVGEAHHDNLDSSIEHIEVRQKTPLDLELEKPLIKEASITYILRKAAELGKDLRREFVECDPLELNVISRTQFWGIIINLPLGLTESEVEEIFDNDLSFDNYGNVDYTHILMSEMFVALERKRIKERVHKRSAELAGKRTKEQAMENAREGLSLDLDFHDENKEKIIPAGDESDDDKEPMDNRKVVVEDLIYIDDLQIIIYSTVSPRTSTLYVTSLKKVEPPKQILDVGGNVKVVNLADLNNYSLAELQMLKRKKAQKDKETSAMQLNRYQLLAKLVGHKNQDPPSICYVSESGCLISGEKHQDAFPLPVVEKKSSGDSEDEKAGDEGPAKPSKCEIIVWNLQRDMVELFSMKPPWSVPCYHKFTAHDASILDIAYMSKTQLIVTSSVDKTIRWWDPATHSYELTDPGNNPHASMRPGYYKPLMKEQTRDNVAYKEVRRVYCGGDTICPALRVLKISDICMNPQNPHIKSSVEWVIALSLQRPLTVQTADQRAAQMGFMMGYGIERVKIEIPARHHDDIVPPYINKQCLELVKARRKQVVQEFHRQLPQVFETTKDQKKVQGELFEQIRGLFMQAILNRKDSKYVNPAPLRQIYQIILRLPARNQFQSFLASSGCSDKLSVSETFLYLQKFMQIHPLRTTQIEFEKSIGDFYHRHQRNYLQGVKRWAKPSLQKFASYIKIHGIELDSFRAPSEESSDPLASRLMLTFCTRERIQEYFTSTVKAKNKEQEDFTDYEVDTVLQELDPYNTGVIQINSIQRLFIEEINYFNQVSANRPDSILQKLRNGMSDKMGLQKALCAVDKEGDGYISKKQFVQAIYDAGIHMVRDEIEFLFSVMSETYHKGGKEEENENESDEFKELNKDLTKQDKKALVLQKGEKYIFLPFLFNKLFHQAELKDYNEIDATLNLVKAALIYKGADFGIIFAEKSQENETKKRGGRGKTKTKESTKVEMGNYYTRFAEQVVNEEFVSRVMQLNAQNVYEPQVKRLANFLALNQKNQSVIYMNTWMHHLRRSGTAFHTADRDMLPVICSKLLRNESAFRANLDTIGMIKNHREQDKFIELADLKSVLQKYNLTYINQCLFLQEFTRKGSVHVEDLVVRMKATVRDYYSPDRQALTQNDLNFNTPADLLPPEARPRPSGEPSNLQEIKNQDFFAQTQKKIRNAGNAVVLQSLQYRFAKFDIGTGQIAAHKLVGVLKHNCAGIFDEGTLKGLQFELESLYNDHQVDWRDFIETFFRESDAEKNAKRAGVTRINLGENKSGKTAYNAQEYEDLMGAFSAHIDKDGIDIENIVQIFSKESGFITYGNLRDIFRLCSFPIKEDQLELIILYADEGQQGSLLAYDIIDRIKFATQIAPEFNVQKWIESAYLLSNKYDLLRICEKYMGDLEEHMQEYHSYNLPVRNKNSKENNGGSSNASEQPLTKPKTSSAVLTGQDFQTMLRREIPQMASSDIDLLTKFCIRGSRRLPDQASKDILNSKRKESLTNAFHDKKKPNVKRPVLADAFFFDCDVEMDVIQFNHFQQAIPEAVRAMTVDAVEQTVAAHGPSKKKHWFFKDALKSNAMTAEQTRREGQLVDKIQSIFRQREYTFYDAFKEVYDPIAKRNLITMKVFKEKVRKLNLPMTVQDHRILRRIAQDNVNPHQVDLKVFCPRFESVMLRKMRLVKILDKLATAFYLQNLNLKRAFQIFDVSGDGIISRREFRQGFTQLDLGLSYDEIDDLMAMISTDGQTISYDEFIHSLDDNIRKRKTSTDGSVEDAMMKKLQEVLTYSGESFWDAMRIYDLEGSETILTVDLPRVFKRLGISTIEPHIPYLLQVGGVRPKDQKIDIPTFVAAIIKEMKMRVSKTKLMKQEVLNKLHSLMKSKELSLFDLFVRLDANHGGSLDKIELRSGIAQMGMNLGVKEFDILWKAVFRKRPHKTPRSSWGSPEKSKKKSEDSIAYTDLLKTFYKAGCIKLQHSVDRSSTLMTKFRQQLKKRGLTVEKAYRLYDPDDDRFVFRNDFKRTSWKDMDLDFEEDELDKIFELLCAEGTAPTESNDQQKQAVDKPKTNNVTRFDQKQFMDAIQISRGENWLNDAFIKIHQVVLQKNLSYKRLFKNWQDKKTKSGQFRLNAAELHAGLKKLRAGLTADEINKMTQSLPFNPKEHDTIHADEFRDQVKAGAEKLKNEKSFQKALLVQWITQFNTQMETNLQPLETLFSSFDEDSKGGLDFDNFTALNEYVGVPMYKTELRKVFDLIDQRRVSRVSIDEVRAIINMASTSLVGVDDSAVETVGIRPEEEGLMRQQVNDVYEKIKEEILTRNITFEQILFTDCKLNPLNLATPAGFTLACEKLGIKVAQDEARQIIQDLRNDNNGKVECTYKNLIEFLTKARINVQFLDKGFIDPMLANAVSQLSLICSYYDLKPLKLFKVFDPDHSGDISKPEFMMNVQGMEMQLSLEEILELFNFMDDKQVNRVSQQQFVDSMSFLMNKMGGPTLLESSATAKSILETRKNVPNKQIVFKILSDICDVLQKDQFTIRQLMVVMDRNKTGYLSRQDFVNVIHSMVESIPLDMVRKVMNFFDNAHTGSIAVSEFIGICQDLLNQKIGSGVFLNMQALPIIKTIINQLAIDCDKFFDEVADLNQTEILQKQKTWEDEMARKRMTESQPDQADAKTATDYKMQLKYQKEAAVPNAITGLSKSILFSQLQKYGVGLSEQDKNILSSVYGMPGSRGKDMLDYEQLDSAFEAAQQQLYSSESLYTKEWERRVFKRIGTYLQKHNKTIKECFELIDTENSQTVTVEDLKTAFIRFDLGISDAGFKVLMSRMDPHKQGYLTQDEFLTRFWSAYTYDEDFDQQKQKELEELQRRQAQSFFGSDQLDPETGIIKMPSVEMTSANIAAARQKILSEYDSKIKMYKVFRAIQHKIRENASVQEAFTKLDSKGVGYLTLMNFQANFSKHFDLSLKKDEVRLLFQEIDSDENGIVQYAEFEEFYQADYIRKADELAKDREVHNTQNEIFDHLLKIIKQRGLTLQEVFDQIDNDQNMFIELEEFHELLEVMGFTITREQTLELMHRMDDNFDGRISYKELKAHIESLGFDVDELDKQAGADRETVAVHVEKEFQWRDKALEIIIRAVNNKLKQKQPDRTQDGCSACVTTATGTSTEPARSLTIAQYFERYDDDMDYYLTPQQFRKAMHDLKEPQLKNNQIERVIHILLEVQKQNPLIYIDRIQKLLTNYTNIETGDGGSVRIDEDLFVYIVEMYDGFSRLMTLVQQVEDKANYVSRHTTDISLRSLTCMANQKTLQKLTKKNTLQQELHQSTLVLLSNEVGNMIKDEGKKCVLDPYFNVDTLVSDQNTSLLSQQQVPSISNTDFDISWTTAQLMPCGAMKYNGHLIQSKAPVDILVYPSEVLTHPSSDGKTYKKHLDLELQMHRYMMGVRHANVFDPSLDDESPRPQEGSQEMDIFSLLGKFEKKIGLGANDKDIYVINRSVDTDKWICFDDFVHQNGGLLNVPLFYNTDAPLYTIRYWAKLILQIMHRVHDVSIILRCLSTKQLYFSRDGTQVRLGNMRNIAKVNARGYVKEGPDIQINLEHNNVYNIERQSTTHNSPSKQDRGSTSRRTDKNERQFSNKCLDDPFLAPEVMFNKSSEQNSKMDVWSFGMVLFCLLTGKKPKSFYAVYREWYRKSHKYDVESGTLPFIPPSRTNFVYDPFSYDFDNPFDASNALDPELGPEVMKQLKGLSEASDADLGKNDSGFDFKSFMKCISKLSYSAMFDKAHQTKFQFKNLGELTQQAERARRKNAPKDRKKKSSKKEEERLHQFTCYASADVLARKNELGLILDIVSSCLELDPKKRPTIRGLINSPLFDIDSSEKTQQLRFCQNAILYRSPTSSVSMRITAPLRQICADVIVHPMSVYESEVAIQQLFSYTADCVRHYQNRQLQGVNEVIAERQKKQGLEDNIPNYLKGMRTEEYSISPNGPLAAQVIKEHVVDMLLFICFRYMENFEAYKARRMEEVTKIADNISQSKAGGPDGMSHIGSSSPANVRFAAGAESSVHNETATQSQFAATTEQQTAATTIDKKEVLRMLAKQKKNHVLASMSRLLKTMVQEMHHYSTPMAPYAHEVLSYMVKFFIGEEHCFGSDIVLQKTSLEGIEPTLKQFLGDRSFFRREEDLDESFRPDSADKRWYLDQKNRKFLEKSNHWNLQLHNEAIKIFKESISESGMGQSCYPVLNDFIHSVTENGGTSHMFSKQMNQLSQLPMERTKDYYNELVPLQESIAKLIKSDEGQDKRNALMLIRQTFQSANPDKIKACLDVRVPKHIIHFLQDPQMEVRQETLLILREISKGLQDEDYEIMHKNSFNLQRETKDPAEEAMMRASARTDVSKTMAKSAASSAAATKRGRQSKQEPRVPQSEIDQMASYIKRIQLTEKQQNEKFISFALDLPNLNFKACKPFLKELATCFRSPVFIAPMIRMLKTENPLETYANKQIILDIIQNLACADEKVLKALNSPACDTYMALLHLLVRATKADAKKRTGNVNRNFVMLQTRATDLFKFMFEQRKPTIIRDLLCIGASSTLLGEQALAIPEFIMLPDLMGDFDYWNGEWNNAREIEIDDLSVRIKDLRCFVKHFYDRSTIPPSTRAKAMQRCMLFFTKVFKLSWSDYFGFGPALHKGGLKAVTEQMKQAQEPPSEERKQNYLELMRQILMFFDWLLTQKRDAFLFNDDYGKENLDFILTYGNKVLQQFRTPIVAGEGKAGFANYMGRKEGDAQFPLIEHGAILQNLQYHLVKLNKPHINELLAFANFGQVLGDQLLMDYEFVCHCVENCAENPSLLNSYVKKNETRLNTIEFLLKNHEHTLKDQLLKSNFLEKVLMDYIHDFREFGIQQSKINVQFLAFRKGYPLRQEAISIFNTILLCKDDAPQVYAELIMQSRRHFLVQQEADLIRQGRITSKEATSLLLFAIILEAKEADLEFVMTQAGVPQTLNAIIKQQPSLETRFPILASYTKVHMS